MWQDISLSAIGIIFNISLVLQLKDVVNGKSKMNTTNCVITCIGCIIIGYIDFTLNLPFAAIIAVVTGIIWGSMLVFPYIGPTIASGLAENLIKKNE